MMLGLQCRIFLQFVKRKQTHRNLLDESLIRVSFFYFSKKTTLSLVVNRIQDLSYSKYTQPKTIF